MHGLFTYDGYSYLPARHQDNEGSSLNSVEYTSIETGSEGVIWAGTKGYGLYRLDEKSRKFRRFNHQPADDRSLDSDYIKSIQVDEQGGVWVITNVGVNFVDPMSHEVERYPIIGGVSGALEDGVLDDNSHLVIADLDGVYRLKLVGKTFEVITKVISKDYKVNRLYIDDVKRLWIGGAFSSLKIVSPDGIVSDWPDVVDVHDVTAVGSDELWVASYRKGVYVFDARDATIKNRYVADKFRPGAFNNDNLLSLYVDESGLVWLGMRDAELWISTPSREFTRSIIYSPINKKPEYKSEWSGATETNGGKFWFSTYTDGIDVYDPKKGFERSINTSPDSKPSLPTNKIRWLHRSRDGYIWIATQDAGLLRYTDADVGGRKSSDLLECDFKTPWDGMIYRVLQTMDGGLLAFSRTPNAVFRLYNDAHSCYMVKIEGDAPVESSWVTDVDEKKSILTRNGNNFLLKAGSKRAKQLDLVLESNDSEQKPDFVGGYRTQSGQLYFSSNSTIYQMTHLSETSLHLKKVHSDNREVWIFDEDEMGNEWGYGVYRLSGQNSIQRLGVADGELEGLGQSIEFLRSSDGILINMSRYGIQLHKTNSFKSWRYQPPLVLTDIEVDSIKRDSVAAPLVLSEKESDFSISFAALDYSGSADIRYKFKLQGYSKNWNEVSADARVANYIDVPPGDYQFRLRSTNRVGEWSDYELSLPVIVIPAWYQSLWFKFLIFLTLVACLYALYLWRLSYYRQKKVELENLVAERTDDLLETREKLAVNEKQAALGRLVSGVAHEVNTPLGVAKMASSVIESSAIDIFKELSKDTVNEVFVNQRFKKFESSAELLNRNYDRLSGLVDSFKDISIDESQWQFSEFCLPEKIATVQDMFQERLQERAVAVELDVAEDLLLYSCSSLFNKLLEEFFENALAHAFEGEAAVARHINISAYWSGQQKGGDRFFVLEFSDNGSGVAKEMAPVIFDPFTAHSPSNIGLGLHVLLNLVANVIDGSLECFSEPGKGTSFVLKCPEISADL